MFEGSFMYPDTNTNPLIKCIYKKNQEIILCPEGVSIRTVGEFDHYFFFS